MKYRVATMHPITASGQRKLRMTEMVEFKDTIIGVTSYGALGHVPPLELAHVKKIWQFLR